MWKPKKVSGMGWIVSILLAILFFATLLTVIIPIIILIVDTIIYYCTLKKNCCPECKGKECVIPINTPIGQKLLRDFSDGSNNTTPQNAKQEVSGRLYYDERTHQYVKEY